MVSFTSLMAASRWSGDPSNLVTRACMSILPFFVTREAYARGVPDRLTTPLSDPELVQRTMKVRRVAVHAERARRHELVPAVAAREQTDAQHSRATRREKIPHRVADDIAVRWHQAKLLLALEEEIRLGFRAKNIASIDDHRLRRHAERDERRIDLGVATRGRDAVRYAGIAKPPEKLDRPGQRTALGQEIAKERAVARLDALGLIVAERSSGLPSDGPREETAAHSDAPVHLPALDAEPRLGERPLPREDVRVDRVHQRSVKIEDQGAHGRREPTPARRPGLGGRAGSRGRQPPPRSEEDPENSPRLWPPPAGGISPPDRR